MFTYIVFYEGEFPIRIDVPLGAKLKHSLLTNCWAYLVKGDTWYNYTNGEMAYYREDTVPSSIRAQLLLVL